MDDTFARTPSTNSEPTGVTRRQVLPLFGVLGLAAAPPVFAQALQSHKPTSAQARYVYVGTYTAPDVPPGGTHPSSAVGIPVVKVNPDDRTLTLVQSVTTSNPPNLPQNPSTA